MGLTEVFEFESELPDPSMDGITHINTYSKGKTELGRMLSNFYYAPFTHPEFGDFISIEGFWFWYKTGQQYDILRELYGYAAKKEGQKYPVQDIDWDVFHSKVLECIALKILANPEIYNELKSSTLPFIHYYSYGTANPKVINVECQWMMDGITEIRRIINE